MDIMIKLFSYLEIMESNQIQHGNITSENIILDLSSSRYTLDNHPNEIQFELKLINFANFYD